MIMSLTKKISIIVVAFSVFYILFNIYLSKTWGTITIEQAIFTLNTYANIEPQFIESLLRRARQFGFIFLCIMMCYCIFIYKIHLSSSTKKKLQLISFLLPCIAIIHFVVKFNVLSYIMRESSSFIEEHYKADTKNITWKTKKNLVLIIAESLENAYTDKRIFDPIPVPRLRNLQQVNTFFPQHIQTYGTGWTIAGITSYMFGIPLKLPIQGNSYTASQFLPGANSILNVMEQAGYSLQFISGWDSRFSGYSNLIATHSMGINCDQSFFQKEGYSLDKFGGSWGFKDSFIFDYAKKILNALHEKHTPYALIINTVDTHPPHGFSEEKYRKFNNICDAYANLDANINDFVAYVLQKDPENTSIVILGDHLSMTNDVTQSNLDKIREMRTIYNCFINPYKQPVQTSQMCTSIDMAPTILETIGCILPEGRFGLGVSLYSDKPTLVAQNYEQYHSEIPKYSLLYDSFFKPNKKYDK